MQCVKIKKHLVEKFIMPGLVTNSPRSEGCEI